jgi:hypothetical protein
VTYIPSAYTHNLISESNPVTLEFEYAIYALGAKLPAPIDLWGAKGVFDKAAGLPKDRAEIGTREAGIEWLKDAQAQLEDVRSVLVAGGGALGIRQLIFPSWVACC